MRALTEYLHKLLENNVSIFVRRGGPNFQEGLRAMREVGAKLGLKMYVFGPDTHMTAIVGMALGTRPIPKSGLIEKSGSSLSVMGMKNVSVYIIITIEALINSCHRKIIVSFSNVTVVYNNYNHTLSKVNFSLYFFITYIPQCKYTMIATPPLPPQMSLSQSSSTNSMSELEQSSSRSASPRLSRNVAVCLWTPDQERAFPPPTKMLFTNSTVAVIWGMQPRAVQVHIA